MSVAGTPLPSPRTSRPPLTSSRVTAILASIAGLRNPVQAISGPIPIRVVASAAAVRIVQHSQKPNRGRSATCRSRWSGTHSVSTPKASTSSASRRNCAQEA